MILRDPPNLEELDLDDIKQKFRYGDKDQVFYDVIMSIAAYLRTQAAQGPRCTGTTADGDQCKMHVPPLCGNHQPKG